MSPWLSQYLAHHMIRSRLSPCFPRGSISIIIRGERVMGRTQQGRGRNGMGITTLTFSEGERKQIKEMIWYQERDAR